MSTRNRILQLVTLAAVCAFGSAAQADGVDLGDAVLHPSLQLGVGYDSNVFRAGNGDTNDPVAAPRALVTPRLRLTTPNPTGIDLQMLGAMTWHQFLSSDQNVSGQSGAELFADADARINPRGNASLLIGETLRRTNDAAYIPAGETENVLMNDAMVGVGLHPGGAQLSSRMGLSGELRAYHRFWRHNVAETANRQAYGAALDLGYNFLPMTALIGQVDAQWVNWQSPAITTVTQSGADGPTRPTYDGRPIRSNLGFRGLVSRRVSIELAGGYTFVNYTNNTDGSRLPTSTWNTRGGFTYLINADDSFDLTVNRNLIDTAYGNPAQAYTLAADLTRETSEFRVSGRLLYQLFGLLGDTSGLTGNSGSIVATRLTMAVPVADWVDVGAYYQLSANLTDIAVITDIGVGDESYVQHNAFMTIDFRY